MKWNRKAVAAFVGGAALVAGGGTALAAQGDGERAARCQERLAKIAEKRGVTVEQLQAGIRAKLTARVDAALAAGRISPERAARLKERIAQGELCKKPVVQATLAKHGMLRAAAEFLGLTPAELRAQLPGTSLAALAQGQGKSVDALMAAMVAPANAKLARAVAAGRVTQARAERVLERLEAVAERLAQKVFPAG
jgi:hypothetical protein